VTLSPVRCTSCGITTLVPEVKGHLPINVLSSSIKSNPRHIVAGVPHPLSRTPTILALPANTQAMVLVKLWGGETWVNDGRSEWEGVRPTFLTSFGEKCHTPVP